MASEQERCSAEEYADLLQRRRELELRVISKACTDDAFRKKLLSDPKAAFGEEFGVALPAEVTINVREETPTTGYLRIPAAPKVVQMSEELSDKALEGVAGGGVIIAYEDAGGAYALVVVSKRTRGSNWGFVVY